MTSCCPEFTEHGFRHKGFGKYECCSCRRDVTVDVVDMFFRDPWGTISMKRKPKGGAE